MLGVSPHGTGGTGDLFGSTALGGGDGCFGGSTAWAALGGMGTATIFTAVTLGAAAGEGGDVFTAAAAAAALASALAAFALASSSPTR